MESFEEQDAEQPEVQASHTAPQNDRPLNFREFVARHLKGSEHWIWERVLKTHYGNRAMAVADWWKALEDKKNA